MSFHLAYLKLNTDFFMSGKPTSEKLQYALVPVDLAAKGQWYLDRIDLNGRPEGRFPAMPEFLRTLRRPGIEMGSEDPVERRLIEHLKGRALAASHVVPEIVATGRTPGWSKLVLPAHVVAELQRLGGLGL
jgi:hypothetical protein